MHVLADTKLEQCAVIQFSCVTSSSVRQ